MNKIKTDIKINDVILSYNGKYIAIRSQTSIKI